MILIAAYNAYIDNFSQERSERHNLYRRPIRSAGKTAYTFSSDSFIAFPYFLVQEPFKKVELGSTYNV